MANLIEIKDLVIDYGIVRAIKGININVKEGSIVAILGANGAGKSTTIRSLSGVVKVKSGQILYKGENIANKDPHKIASLGIIPSPEGRLIFRGLTTEENLLVGAYKIQKDKGVSARTIRNETLEEVYSYFPVLKERRKQQASTLSGGEQQMLAIGRALMARPKLLLMDEPSLGLAPLIVQEIFRIISEIKKRGTTILIVEQNAHQTLKIADYCYVLELGKVRVKGSPEELMKDDSIVEAYLGVTKQSD